MKKAFISNRSKSSLNKHDILTISGLANKDTKKGFKTINASVGAYYDEKKKFGRVPTIENAIKEKFSEKMAYASVTGYEEYKKGILSYAFGERLKTIKEKNETFFGATLGGTGALSIAFNLFTDEDSEVLLPDVMWSNYKLIASKAHCSYRTYKLFDESDNWNLSSIKEEVDREITRKGRALLLINDPCENPTGYSMSKKEYEDLFAYLNKKGEEGSLIVAFDIAYYNFSSGECPLFEMLEGELNFLPIIVFSCSKSFAIYGFRCGAFIALCPDKESKEDIGNAFRAQVRGTVSSPVGPVLHSVGETLLDEEKVKEVAKEINVNKMALVERGNYLTSLLDEAGIKHYPYKSGFFLTLKVENAVATFDALAGKHIYVVPIDEDKVRIALSGITTTECKELVDALKSL
ncbi:MAG: aminotransferase class I/II-fold pyridoxal phosphate-dependent enzyme [Bacilli bacterium]|nr:aminotransferase class I/II-fold pyridoxal phosphate-dependent enzyme [Bacilli bacterium]